MGPWIEIEMNAPMPRCKFVPMTQHPNYAFAGAKLGWRFRRLILGPKARPLGSALLQDRQGVLTGRTAILTRGPIWDASLSLADCRAALVDLNRHLLREFRSLQATPDRIGGDDPGGGRGWLTTMTPCTAAHLPIGPKADMLDALHGKWRNRLKRAEASDLTIREKAIPADRGHWILEKERQQRSERGYVGAPPALTLAWLQSGGSSNRLFEAFSKNGVRVAAMLFLIHEPGASYHIGWTNSEGRRLNAHNLLLWRAMLWASRRGIAGIELDLLDTEGLPGLARFKLGAGAKPLALGATRLLAPGTALISRLVRDNAA